MQYVLKEFINIKKINYNVLGLEILEHLRVK